MSEPQILLLVCMADPTQYRLLHPMNNVLWRLNSEVQSDLHPAIWRAKCSCKRPNIPLPILIWLGPHSKEICVLSSRQFPSLCTPPNEVSNPSQWSTQCPVITVNSGKTRIPPGLRLKSGFIHSGIFSLSLWTESDYLPNQGTSTAKECNPCKTQGHSFSNQKHVSHCREAARDVGRGRKPEWSQDAKVHGREVAACLNRCFWKAPAGKIPGSANGCNEPRLPGKPERAVPSARSFKARTRKTLWRRNTVEPFSVAQEMGKNPWNRGLIISSSALKEDRCCISSTETRGRWLALNRSLPPALGRGLRWWG